MIEWVGTMTAAEAPWKRRSSAYDQLSGIGERLETYSGKRVW